MKNVIRSIWGVIFSVVVAVVGIVGYCKGYVIGVFHAIRNRMN